MNVTDAQRMIACTRPTIFLYYFDAEDIDGKIFVENRIKASIANKKLCFGGKREVGETPMDCIKRECKEELNGLQTRSK